MANLSTLMKRREDLQKEILQLQRFISSSPPGRLISRKTEGSGFSYSQKIVLPNGRNHEVYLGKQDQKLASAIAGRMIAEKRLMDLQQELKMLDASIAYLQKESNEQQFRKKHPGLCHLLANFPASISEQAAEWKNVPYNRNQKYPESLKYPTIIPGLIVRSKSEASIVACLERNHVPYHYDEIETISGQELAIDFICRNVRTNQKWYWDHRGMLDSEDYIRKTLYTDSLFYQAGIIQGINLIVTCETRDCPLDPQWVEALIQHFLL